MMVCMTMREFLGGVNRATAIGETMNAGQYWRVIDQNFQEA